MKYLLCEGHNVLSSRREIHGQLGERKPRIVKRCSCGQEYTLSQFRTLEYKGIQKIHDGELPHEMELRDCSCRSTIMIGLDFDGNYYHEETK
jgi:hypothetical protein